MRFALILFVILLSHTAWADIPVPTKKPTKNTFQALIDRAVSDIQRDNPMEELDERPSAQIAPVLPPALPESKRVAAPQIQQPETKIAEGTVVVNGIPLPATKPNRTGNKSNYIALRSSETGTGFLRLPPQQAREVPRPPETNIIQYEGPDNDERTAGRKTYARDDQDNQIQNTERIYASRTGKLRETTEKSPFRTAKLPKADRTAMGDPIIIFFKEGSPELEVGQLDILKDDVLRPLQRSTRIHAVIYGFAEGKNSEATKQLSSQRAAMIQDYLDQNRVKSDRVAAYGQGSDTPIDPKDRVDIILSQ